jgi:hypothetical protein
MVVGCGRLERLATGITGNLSYKCSKSGVEYVQSDSGLAVHVNKDGTPVTCSDQTSNLAPEVKKDLQRAYLKDANTVQFKVTDIQTKNTSILDQEKLDMLVSEVIREKLANMDTKKFMSNQGKNDLTMFIKKTVEKRVLERYFEKETFSYQLLFVEPQNT